MKTNPNIRNIAIIAHVDHGKTSLVDQMFQQAGLFRDNQETEERLMDNMDLEKERGITIAAKNCAVNWNGVKVNILDTPGHADFGGEVERAMMMVDGALLLVDSSEGPLPQTRFVLRKALDKGLKIIVVVNKIDRSDARAEEVLDEIYDLFIDLDATDEQIDFPVIYAIGREGIAQTELKSAGTDLAPLMDKVVDFLPGPSYDESAPFQMLVSDLDYSDFTGRLAIGRIHNGTVTKNDALVCIGADGEGQSLRATKLQVYDGIGMEETDSVEPGEILILSGIEKVEIGDTIATAAAPVALPRIAIDEPTLSMIFGVNTSPLAGLDGKHVQGGKIKERLELESLRNVSVQMEPTATGESFVVKGRGELQMAVLIEIMRREDFEFTVGRPQVIFKEVDGKKLEPIEDVFIDCEEEFLGIVSEKLAVRKGQMKSIDNDGSGRVKVGFEVPSRGLIGYRNEFLTDTRGTGIMNSQLNRYDEFRGKFPQRAAGSLVSDRTGKAVAYALFHLEPRGKMFIVAGDPVYEGSIIGQHSRDSDLDVNACKEKKQTNVRASGTDESLRLTPIVPPSLEQCIEYLTDDECLEITPKAVRIRKVHLTINERKRNKAK